jgi:branched-chain amino acid transport system permease protein
MDSLCPQCSAFLDSLFGKLETFWSILTSDYAVHLAILVGIYLILAQGFNLTFGVGRLFNLAHVAAYAIGAYTTALLSTGIDLSFMGHLLPDSAVAPFLSLLPCQPDACATLDDIKISFFTCIIASLVLSGLFAFSIGAISLRLTQEYFAIGTIAFASVISALLINWKSLTRGVLGIPGIPRPRSQLLDSVLSRFVIDYKGGDFFYNNTNFLILLGVFVVIVQIVCWFIFKSSFARSLRAQAESEVSALALGKQTQFDRNVSFFISSALAGLAGSFFAYYLNYIDPSSFAFPEMVFVLTIVVVGSPGSFWGVMLACFFLVLLPEPLRFLEIDSSILGPMRQLLHALILFGVVYWKRETLFPVERKV